MNIPEHSIMEAAHQLATFAVDQRDSVNMYSAVREKAVEVLTRLIGACGLQATVVNCDHDQATIPTP